MEWQCHMTCSCVSHDAKGLPWKWDAHKVNCAKKFLSPSEITMILKFSAEARELFVLHSGWSCRLLTFSTSTTTLPSLSWKYFMTCCTESHSITGMKCQQRLINSYTADTGDPQQQVSQHAKQSTLNRQNGHRRLSICLRDLFSLLTLSEDFS